MSDEDYKRGYREGYQDGVKDGQGRFINRPVPPVPNPTIPWPPSREYYGSVATCPNCKMEFKGIMGYSCGNSYCPMQPKVTG